MAVILNIDEVCRGPQNIRFENDGREQREYSTAGKIKVHYVVSSSILDFLLLYWIFFTTERM